MIMLRVTLHNIFAQQPRQESLRYYLLQIEKGVVEMIENGTSMMGANKRENGQTGGREHMPAGSRECDRCER